MNLHPFEYFRVDSNLTVSEVRNILEKIIFKYIGAKKGGTMGKKISFLVIMLLMLTLPAFAEKTKFKDKNYDFKGLIKIQAMEIASAQPASTDNLIQEKDADDIVKNAVIKAFKKKEIAVKEVTVFNQIRPKLGFTVKIYNLGYEQIWHDAYISIENTYKSVDVDTYDENGKPTTITVDVPVTEAVEHEAGYSYAAKADIEFTVYDVRNNRVVYSVRDVRDKQGFRETDGMVERICNDFVNDITK